MGSKSKGPSMQEQMMLQMQAEARAQAERDRIKAQQDIERGRVDQQMAAEKESQAARMNELKTQTELQKNEYEKQRADAEKKEADKLLDEKSQEELKVKLEQESARNQSELNSKQLAEYMARKQTSLAEMWYSDNDDEFDPANETTGAKRKKASKAQASSVEALWQ